MVDRKSLHGPRRVTLGGRKLVTYLPKRGLSVKRFAEIAGVQRLTVYRVMAGQKNRNISIDFGWAIELATHGEIVTTDFGAHTAEEVDDGDDDGPRAES